MVRKRYPGLRTGNQNTRLARDKAHPVTGIEQLLCRPEANLRGSAKHQNHWGTLRLALTRSPGRRDDAFLVAIGRREQQNSLLVMQSNRAGSKVALLATTAEAS